MHIEPFSTMNSCPYKFEYYKKDIKGNKFKKAFEYTTPNKKPKIMSLSIKQNFVVNDEKKNVDGYLSSSSLIRKINFNTAVELHSNSNSNNNSNLNNDEKNSNLNTKEKEEEAKYDNNYYNYINSGYLAHNLNLNELIDELENFEENEEEEENEETKETINPILLNQQSFENNHYSNSCTFDVNNAISQNFDYNEQSSSVPMEIDIDDNKN